MYKHCICLQLVYSSGQLIDALLGGAAQNYLEFKLLQQRCFISTPDTTEPGTCLACRIGGTTSARVCALWLA